MVGPKGRVVSVDIQEKMIAALRKRAARAGLLDRIETRLISADTLGIADLNGRIDFALAFAVVHEVPDQDSLFREVHAALKPEGVLLMSDPRSHFSREESDRAVARATQAGLTKIDGTAIWRSRRPCSGKTPEAADLAYPVAENLFTCHAATVPQP